MVGFDAPRFLKLLAAAGVQALPQAPFGQLHVRLGPASKQPELLQLIRFFERSHLGLDIAGRQTNLARPQQHDVIIARLRDLPFQHISIPQQ